MKHRVLRIHDVGGVRQLEMEAEHYTVGRAHDNDLRIAVTTVSAHHAALVRKDDDYWLEDLLSTNGSYINGHRVQRRKLCDGDVLMLADCRMEYFEITEPQAAGSGVRTRMYSGALVEDEFGMGARPQTPTKRQPHRKGEAGQIPYRTGRFFNVGGSWYFSTREGEDIGPFDSLHAARAGLVEYGRKVGFLAGFDDNVYSL